jgi:hypothetical protein
MIQVNSLLQHIFSYLRINEQYQIALVCKPFRELLNDTEIHEVKIFYNLNNQQYKNYTFPWNIHKTPTFGKFIGANILEPIDYKRFKYLKSLSCEQTKFFTNFDMFPELERLDYYLCNGITHWPPKLKSLEIGENYSILTSYPPLPPLPLGLEELDAVNTEAGYLIPNEVLMSIKRLEIDCLKPNQLEFLHNVIELKVANLHSILEFTGMPLIKKLEIWMQNFQTIHDLPNLEKITLINESVGDGVRIYNCPKLRCIHAKSGGIIKEIINCPSI